MSRAARIFLIVSGAALALLALALAIVAATFDPNDYKPLIVKWVQDKTQRTLAIPGDIKLTFFPRIGIDLGRLTLSEKNSNAPFASVDSAKLSLAPVPLLSKRLVVDRIYIDGLRMTITRKKDGGANGEDSTARDASGRPPEPAEFTIGGIDISNAHLSFLDREAGRKLTLSDAQLKTGKIAGGAPSKLEFAGHLSADRPAIDAHLAWKSGFTADFGGKHFVLNRIDAQIKGKLLGLNDAALRLSGNLDMQMADQRAAFNDTKLALSARQGGRDMNLQAQGNALLDWKKQVLSSTWQGKLDESAFDARLGMEGFSPAAYSFDIGIDRFDADRYREGASGAIPKGGAQKGPGQKPDAKPIDLSAWRDVQAQGNVRIGALSFSNIKLTAVAAKVHAGGGRIALDPLTANLYGGQANGSMSATATAAPRIGVKQYLNDVQVGPLLQDAIGKQPIEGRGNVDLDVGASGGGFAQIKKSLDGTARLELRDGAVHGVNVAQAIRNAKARINRLRGKEAPQAGTASAAEKTDFSELTASFRINNGVAHNDDLLVKSPLLRVTGSGDVDLGEERLDYLARATVVSALEGQGGPELQTLKGLTVPVRLTGPFDAIQWQIDFQGLIGDAARQKLEEKKAEVREKAQRSLEEQKEKLREQLKEGLKGLFGK